MSGGRVATWPANAEAMRAVSNISKQITTCAGQFMEICANTDCRAILAPSSCRISSGLWLPARVLYERIQDAGPDSDREIGANAGVGGDGL